MSDVIPTGASRDSLFLFERMTSATLESLGIRPQGRVLDVASGFGQDALALAGEGAWAVGADPSARMTAFARTKAEEAAEAATGARGGAARLVRSWADALPFADGSFDAVFCKGALDHFDRPGAAVAEMARVAGPRGRVVLAVANFDSLACRAARLADAAREGALRRPPRPGRRAYDVPSDHFTRYELGALRAEAERHLAVERVRGVSLAWGLPAWTRTVQRLPEAWAERALRALDAAARRLPALADVMVLSGRPRAAL